ncbi:MAG: hypothetical protein M3P98_01225 [bacterium]|nr:hypothetical protein [bacterium]
MSPEKIIAIVGGVVVGLTMLVIVIRVTMKRTPIKFKKEKYKKQWVQLQAYCKEEKTWPEALVSADQLLDKALKKRNFKGREMGERLVAAQREFKDNDGVWYGHKLAKKVEENPDYKITKTNVKDALLGIGQALKDLGAL